MTVAVEQMRAVDAQASILKVRYAAAAGNGGKDGRRADGAEEEEEETADWAAEAVFTGLWTYLMVFVGHREASARGDKKVKVVFDDAEDARACVTSFLKSMSEAVRRLWDANVRAGMPVPRHDIGYAFEKESALRKGTIGGGGSRGRQAYTMARDAVLVSEKRVWREALSLRRSTGSGGAGEGGSGGDLDALASFFEDPRRVTSWDVVDDADEEEAGEAKRRAHDGSFFAQVMMYVCVGSRTSYRGIYAYIPVPAGETSFGRDDVSLRRMPIHRMMMHHPLYARDEETSVFA